MSKSNKIIAGLGVAAALGVAAMPLAGVFADSITGGSPDNDGSQAVTLKYHIPVSLVLTYTDGAGGAAAEDITTATLTAGNAHTSKTSTFNVAGNSAYNFTVIDTDSDNTLNNNKGASIAPVALYNSSTNTTGTAIPADPVVDAWGLKLSAAASGFTSQLVADNYMGVDVATGTPLEVMKRATYNSNTAIDDTATVNYAAAAAAGKPAGTYSDTIDYVLSAIIAE